MAESEFETSDVLNLRIFLIALILTIASFILITSIVSYQKYYYNSGIVYRDGTEYYLKMFVDVEDVKEILEYDTITIDGENYKYHVYYIQKDLYVNESYKNYQEIMLKTTIKYPIENRVVDISIKTKKEKIIKFIYDCIKGGSKE